MTHALFTGEVAPPAVPFVLTLMALCVFVACSAGAYTAKWAIDFIFKTLFIALYAVPFVGKRVRHATQGLGNRASNALGSIAEQSNRRVGQYFWRVAHTITGVLELLAAVAVLQGLLAWYVTVKYPLALLHKATSAVGGKVTYITRTYPKTVQKLNVDRKLLKRLVAAAVGAAVIGKHVVITSVGGVGALKSRVGWTVRQIKYLQHRVGRLEARTVGLGAVAMVSAVFVRMGIGFLRCRNFKRAGSRVCGMDTDLLESLLAGSLILAGSISIVQLAEELQEPTVLVSEAMSSLIRELEPG